MMWTPSLLACLMVVITPIFGEETEFMYWDECRTTQMGQLFSGDVDVTASGKECQRWDTTSPHDHNMEPQNFPEGSLRGGQNYCRNPTNAPGGPWCFTTDPDTRWEYCDIPICEGLEELIFEDCRLDVRGLIYRGVKSTTRSGHQCQNWVQQSPHEHSTSWEGFPDGSLQAAANYCRNPDGKPDGPWCYTTDPEVEWEYCDIPYC